MPITMLAFISYAFMIASFAVLSILTFGKHLQIPVIDNGFDFTNTYADQHILEVDQRVLFAAKVIFILSLLCGFYIYQDKMFHSLGKLKTMITEGRNHVNSNILGKMDDSAEEDNSESYPMVAFKILLLSLIWFVSIKVP
jgi:hypothetical protein